MRNGRRGPRKAALGRTEILKCHPVAFGHDPKGKVHLSRVLIMKPSESHFRRTSVGAVWRASQKEVTLKTGRPAGDLSGSPPEGWPQKPLRERWRPFLPSLPGTLCPIARAATEEPARPADSVPGKAAGGPGHRESSRVFLKLDLSPSPPGWSQVKEHFFLSAKQPTKSSMQIWKNWIPPFRRDHHYLPF